MKRIAVISLCVLISTATYGQKGKKDFAFSADIASLIFSNNIELDFSYAFSEHWSVGGTTSVNIGEYRMNALNRNHNELLSKKAHTTEDKLYSELKGGFCYWPDEFYKGAYIGFHCCFNSFSKADLELSCGYSFNIWKGFGTSLGYELKLFELKKNYNFLLKGIYWKIHYLF